MKKRIKILAVLFLFLTLITITIFGFYLKMGLEFGNAAKESITAIELAKKDWKKEKVNPIDSIKLDAETSINKAPRK